MAHHCRRLVALHLVAAGLLVAPVPAPGEEWLVDVAPAAGLTFRHDNGGTGEHYFAEIMGAGGALFDYDGDGDLDAYLIQGGPLERGGGEASSGAGDRLFRNDLARPDGGFPVLRFTDVTEASGLAATGYGMAAATGDVDNDGDVDLYVANFGSNQLWRNEGDGTFTDVTARAGADDPRWSIAVSFVDYDQDGWLDLYVGNYVGFSLAGHRPCYNRAGVEDYCGPLSYEPVPNRLLHNRGDGTFEDVSASSAVGREPGSTLGVITADFDGDGRPDLYEANDLMPNRLWVLREDGTFTDEALLAGCALSGEGRREASMGVAAADLDGDGSEDLFMTHLVHQTNTLFLNDGQGVFRDVTDERGLGTPSWNLTGFGTAAFDLDNDGWLDLFVANGAVTILPELAAAGDPFPFHQPNQLYANRGGGRFEEVSHQAGRAFQVSRASRGAAFGDVDEDGDTDVLVTNNHGPAELLLNQVGQAAHRLAIRALERPGGRDLVGTRVGVTAPGRPALWRRVATDGSYASAGDPRALAGLGTGAPAAVTVEVHWPGGRRAHYRDLPPDRTYVLYRRWSGRPGAAGTAFRGGRSKELRRSGLHPRPTVLLAALLALPAAPRAGAPALLSIPHPRPEQMGERVREQAAVLRRRLATVEGDPGACAGELAQVYGELGQLYHTYLFPRAAAACYDNARRLAPEVVDWLYYRAILAQQERDLEVAADLYLSLLERSPGDLAARLRLAAVERGRRKLPRARELYQEVLASSPQSAEAHAGLGRIAQAEGRNQEAVEHYRQALALQPQADLLHYQLALALRDLGEEAAARAHLSLAGRRDTTFHDPRLEALTPDSVGSLLAQGGRALHQGDYRRAVTVLRRAAGEAPGNPTVLDSLGSALLARGDAGEAVRVFREAVQLGPEQPRAHYNLALALRQVGEETAAVERLRTALELAPDYAAAHHSLAEALADDGSYEEAAEHFARAVELAPQDQQARLGRARILARLGRAQEAVRELEELSRARPGDPVVFLDLATVRQQSGDLPGAIQALERIEELDVEPFTRALARFNVGNLHLAQGRLAAAAEAYRRALAAEEGFNDAHFNLATVLLRLGELEGALEHFDAVLARVDDDPGALAGRALALALAGRHQEAVAAFRAGIERQPQDPRLLQGLARLLAAAPDPGVRRPEEALVLASRLYAARRTLPHAETMAMALAAAGRFREAAELQEQVMAGARQAGAGSGLLDPLAANLERYQANRPALYTP